MKKHMKLFSGLTLLLFALTACGPKLGAYDVSADNARQMQEIMYGRVTAIHHARINNDGSVGETLSLVGGAVIGALIGNMFGGGSGKTLATIGGGLAGTAAGYGAGQALNNQEGYEIEVELDSGRRVSVVQGTDQSFHVGQSVAIIKSSDGVRVTPR